MACAASDQRHRAADHDRGYICGAGGEARLPAAFTHVEAFGIMEQMTTSSTSTAFCLPSAGVRIALIRKTEAAAGVLPIFFGGLRWAMLVMAPRRRRRDADHRQQRFDLADLLDWRRQKAGR